jgi:hypothetical protein
MICYGCTKLSGPLLILTTILTDAPQLAPQRRKLPRKNQGAGLFDFGGEGGAGGLLKARTVMVRVAVSPGAVTPPALKRR